MTPDFEIFSSLFVRIRSIRVADVPLILVGSSIIRDSQGDFKISQFKSPIIITSLFSISLFLKKASYSSKRADCELGALYQQVLTKNDLL
jgi:hypothetical protein